MKVLSTLKSKATSQQFQLVTGLTVLNCKLLISTFEESSQKHEFDQQPGDIFVLYMLYCHRIILSGNAYSYVKFIVYAAHHYACRFIVHRQLSADSFYINVDHVVQLGNFTRARAVVDDEFIGETEEPVWVKRAAPEVLQRRRYSTKSDVWALAIVFWEVL